MAPRLEWSGEKTGDRSKSTTEERGPSFPLFLVQSERSDYPIRVTEERDKFKTDLVKEVLSATRFVSQVIVLLFGPSTRT